LGGFTKWAVTRDLKAQCSTLVWARWHSCIFCDGRWVEHG